MTCTRCNGTGELGPYEDCSWCDGTGGRVQTGPAPLPEKTRKATGASIPVAAPTQGADARPVAELSAKVKWDIAGRVQAQCERLGSCVTFRSAASQAINDTLDALNATRDAAPSDAQLHIAADEVIRIANAYFGIYPQDDPMRVDFKTAVFNASREFSKDARRYQALRDRDLDALKTGSVFAGMIPENVVLNGADLDAAADKLLSAIAPMEKT